MVLLWDAFGMFMVLLWYMYDICFIVCLWYVYGSFMESTVIEWVFYGK